MARRKYKYVESFINPETGQPFENTGSPARKDCGPFGMRTLHQIAKIEFEGKIVSSQNGDGEQTRYLIEKMGEKGGWIEAESNLAQDGECWVGEGGIVCESAYVSGNVKINGGYIGGSARISDNASIIGAPLIEGNACIFGDAEISGGVITDRAMVGGNVGGSVNIVENAFIGTTGEVNGSESVVISGNARVYGQVYGEDIQIQDNATIYGAVTSGSIIRGTTVVLETGVVSGQSLVEGNAIVGGKVDGSTISENANILDTAEVTKGSNVKGNSKVGGILDEGDVEGNAYVGEKVTGKALEMSGNATVLGTSTEIESSKVVENALVGGKCWTSTIEGNTIVGTNGRIQDAGVSGNSLLNGGTVNSNVSGGVSIGEISRSQLQENANVSGSVGRTKISGNGNVSGSMYEGSVGGNGNVSARVGYCSGKVEDNGVFAGDGFYEVSGNDVFVEVPAGDKALIPEGTAVIGTVEKT